MSMSSNAVDAVDVTAWVDGELAAIMSGIEPMPTFEPLTSGLCGYCWWDSLPWGEQDGPGLRCTKDAGHPGSCESRGTDGTVYATLRAKTRETRRQVPSQVVAS